MKIFLIIPTLGKGGAERVISNLSKGLSFLGHSVFVIIFCNPVSYKTYGELINFDINYTSSNKLKVLYNLIKVVGCIRKEKKKHNPDHVISFMDYANVCTALVFRGKCSISERRNPDRSSSLFKFLKRFLYPKVDKVIAVSENLQEKLVRLYQLKNSCFIYNPLDIDYIALKSQENINFDCPFLLSVGRLDDNKNHILLLKAYAELWKNEISFPKLIIAGDGVLKAALEKAADNYGVKEKVVFLGNLENPYSYMKRCSVFILPSLTEGFPNVLIEALACGAVCVSTDCETGPREILTHGVNGFLIKNNDVKEMVGAISFALKGKFDKEKLRKNAIKSVQKFSLLSVCETYLEK